MPPPPTCDMMEAGSDGKETEGCANGISRGSGEGWGKRRERSRATRNEEKEMRWSTTSQGVVTGSGPFACPKKAKRLDRGLWASWREKPLLLSTSKKFPFPHPRRKSDKGSGRAISARSLRDSVPTGHDAGPLPLHLAHISQKVGWQPCRGAQLGGHRI